MFERLRGRLSKKATHQTENGSTAKKPKGSPIVLKLSDKHEPFGAITIEKIKQVLEEEDFAELQSLYYYMMRDLKIASVVLARRQPLLGLSYKMESDNEEFVEWVKSNVKLDELINLVSFSVYYGVSLVDIQYEVKEGKLEPNFKLVSPRFIHAHKDTTLKSTIEHLYVKQGDKKLFISDIDPDKRVFHKHPIDIGEITDFSLASKLVWYFSLKHLALAHNLQYFDNVATPPLIAKTEGDEEDLIDTLYQLKSSSVGVFGKEDVVEYLNINSKADFLSFIEYIDRQIATLVLGNTLSTGEGSKGSYSQSQTHENRQKEVLGFDARLINATITDYLNKLERLNFGNPKGITFKFDLKAKKDLKELSEVVKNLSDSGFELDQEDIQNQFGIKIVGKKQTEPTQPPKQANHREHNSIESRLSCGCVATNAASSHKTKPHDTLDGKQVNTSAIEQALLKSVEKMLENASSYEEAQNALLDAYPNFAIEELESSLFKAIANSTLLADAEVSEAE